MADVSRRSVLVGLTAGATVVALAPGASAHPSATEAPAPPPLGLVPVDVTPVRHLDAAFRAETHAEAPRVVELQGLDATDGVLDGELTFDPRVLAAGDTVVLSGGGQIWTAPAVTGAAPDGTHTLRFTVERPEGPARVAPTVLMMLPLSVRALYPAEDLGTVAPATLVVGRTGDPAVARWQSATVTVPVEPWGAELAAAWCGCPYRYPSGLRVHSVGPGPVAAGTRLELVLDARMVEQVAVLEARLDGAPGLAAPTVSAAAAGDVLHATVLLADAVPAGGVLDLALTVVPRAGATTVDGERVASVTLVGPDDAARPARATGRYSVTDLTACGNPRTEGAVAHG
jgi:hypothetical protein